MKDVKIISDEDYKKVLLQIMDSIDSFCREKNLTYYMVGGTLLGAVRHGGFIPWDDDIDIAMKREDYIDFCNSFNINRSDDFKVVCLNNTSDYYLPFAKVIDTRTSLLENAYQSIEIGAYIDVFPLDFFQAEHYDKAVNLLTHKSIKSKLYAAKAIQLSNDRPFYKNIAIILSRAICRKSINEIACEREKQILSISGSSDCPYLANLCGVWGEREIIQAEYFDSKIELLFEGRKYYSPRGYDGYLHGVYGDYITLPPVEKRISHHDFNVYWKE